MAMFSNKTECGTVFLIPKVTKGRVQCSINKILLLYKNTQTV